MFIDDTTHIFASPRLPICFCSTLRVSAAFALPGSGFGYGSFIVQLRVGRLILTMLGSPERWDDRLFDPEVAMTVEGRVDRRIARYR